MKKYTTHRLVLLALFSAGILLSAGSLAQTTGFSAESADIQEVMSLYEEPDVQPRRAAGPDAPLGMGRLQPGKSEFVIFSETYVVTHTGDSGAGSLRDALEQANSDGGGTILFDIEGAPPFVIQPLTGLPGIFAQVTIDGTSQLGYAPGAPVVVLDGTLAGTGETGIGVNGLRLYPGSDGSLIKGLVVIGFQPGLSGSNVVNGIGIEINSHNNTVESCFVGIDYDGSTMVPNDFGIGIEGSNNIIGGDSDEKRNLIAGNTKTGIDVASLAIGGQGNPVGHNIIRGNYLGTDSSGSEARPNNTNIRVAGDEGNNQVVYNLVSGANNNGLVVSNSAWSNEIHFNLVGTDATGTQALGNRRNGMMINGPFNNITNNLVSGNSSDRAGLTAGINFVGDQTTQNQVHNNKVGTDISGALAIPNEMDGIIIRASGNTLGNSTQGTGNIISGNRLSGVAIINFQFTANGNFLAGNKIGVNASDEPLGNGVDGVQVLGGLQNSFGLNTIAHNGRHGVRLETLTVGNDTFVPRRSNIDKNSIHSNSLLGISLGSNAIIPNDPGDEDVGPNDLLNFPEISEVLFNEGASELHITYTVPTSAYNLSWFIKTQFFATNPGERQGKSFLGEDYFYQADFNNGGKTVIVPIPPGLGFAAGDEITATASDIDDNTSQFGALVVSELMVVEPTMFTITASAGIGGVITPAGQIQVAHGGSQAFVIEADPGYEIADVLVDEESVGAVSDYTFEDVTKDYTIRAEFQEVVVEPVTFTITAVADPAQGGSIEINGAPYTDPVEVEEGETAILVATPATGYYFVNWTENGLEVSTDATYEFLTTANRDLVAHFGLESYEVVLLADPVEGGEVFGAGIYEVGEQVIVSAEANPGYKFLYWTYEDQELEDFEESFEFEMPPFSVTLTAHFGQEVYTITASAGIGGVITPAGQIQVAHGGSQAFVIEADPGYEIADVLVDEESVGAVSDYTFEDVTKDYTIRAEFQEVVVEPVTFTITAVADPAQGGSIEINGAPYTDPVEVEEGDLVTLVAIPADGWEFLFWTENTVLISHDPLLEFTAEADRNLVASFAQEDSPVSFSFDAFVMQGEGSVLVNGELFTDMLFFEDGTIITVEAVPADGWEFSHWEMDLSGTDPVQELLMDFPKEVFAYFIQPAEPEFFELTLLAEPEEGGEVFGAGIYEEGEIVSVSAVANPGFKFLHWTFEGNELPYDESFDFPMFNYDFTLIAHFEAEETDDPDPVLGECSFSQGYWFARPQTVWPFDVTIGGHTFTQEDGNAFWPPNTNTKRAFTQYATIVLSGVDLSLFPALAEAMAVIEDYFANVYPSPASRQVNQAAGYIGDWVDENHCEEDGGFTELSFTADKAESGNTTSILRTVAYPNPFVSQVTLSFILREDSPVRVEVFNMIGNRIDVLHEGQLEGQVVHELRFDAGDLPRGIYFFRIQAGEHIHMERVVRGG
jgi:hypothetical protein